MSIESDRDTRYLRLFRQEARAFLIASQLGDGGRMRSAEKSMLAFYDELGISAKYDAEIFLAEVSRA